jgi:hypothetical protein
MINHDLKTWPDPFQAVWEGKKLFELRRNDRNFRVGDSLLLREWLPDTREYTGRCIQAEVTFVLHGGEFGLPEGLVVMSLSPKMAHSRTSSGTLKAVRDEPL